MSSLDTGLEKAYPPILHFSSSKMYTKYSISIIFAQLLQLPIHRLIPVREAPKPSETLRPRDCKLSITSLQSLGIDVSHVGFEDWWKHELLQSHQTCWWSGCKWFWCSVEVLKLYIYISLYEPTRSSKLEIYLQSLIDTDLSIQINQSKKKKKNDEWYKSNLTIQSSQSHRSVWNHH